MRISDMLVATSNGPRASQGLAGFATLTGWCAHTCRSALASMRAGSGKKGAAWLTGRMAVTIYGVCAVTFHDVMYALEGRGQGFVLAFALGCVLSSVYGLLSRACPSASLS